MPRWLGREQTVFARPKYEETTVLELDLNVPVDDRLFIKK
jgi:hypothetical protein